MLRPARQRGFNLTEAMITLSVLALLAAAGLPSMADWVRSTRVRGLAESTLGGLQKARMEAMRRNQVVTFWMVTPATTASPADDCQLSTASGAWVISQDDPSGACGAAVSTTDAPRLAERYGPGATDVAVKGLAADGSDAGSVSFNGYGQTTRAAGELSTVDISHSDASVHRLRIEITAGGGIRMCDRDVSAADPRACKP